MRLFGLLCFYDEAPAQLAECIKGLRFAGVTHLVAVDGAYDLFPGGKATSPASQRSMIDKTCRSLGMGSVIYVPQKTWAGNEVEKRTFMHALALSVSEPDDWHMVMDTDQVVIEVPSDLHVRLSSCHQDVCEVTFRENGEYFSAPRILFRAIPLRLHRNHYTYLAGDRVLWSAGDMPQEGALDLRDLVVDHRPQGRAPSRLGNRAAYYTRRDELKCEIVVCDRCLVGRAIKRMPTNWVATEVGFVGEWTEVCAQCIPAVDAVNQGALSALALDPRLVTVVSHEGRPYAVADHTRGLPDLFREWLEERE